jgi:Flp pilus assembly protein TadG
VPGPEGTRHRPWRRGQRRGAAMVEFAIVVPLLLLLVMGIMEFGMVMHDYLMLVHATREAARTAAIGQPVSKIKDRVIAAAGLPNLRPDMVQVDTMDPNTNAWVPVGDKADGSQNNVPADGIVRVAVAKYPHNMVTGNFFSWLPGYSNGYFYLQASLTMRRE